MERKQKIELGIAILIVLGLIILLAVILKRQPEKVEPTPTVNLPAATVTPKPSTINPADVPPPKTVSATTIARTFVERIGSYSSESNYANVGDVQSLVTAELGAELKATAEASRKAEAGVGSGYYGISTSFVNAKIEQETETSITLRIQTQREEAFGSPGNAEIRYQEVLVTLIRENEAWRVSAFTWQ